MQFLKSVNNKINSGSSRSVAVKKNIIGSFLLKGISILISLMLVPMTLGYVNSELYGIWLTLSSIMVWLGFFDIGFTLGLKNKLAEAIALNDWERGRSLVSTTYVMMLLIFVPLCCVAELLIPLVNWASFLNISAGYNAEITRVMHVLLAFFCIQMIVNVLVAVISAFQKVALSSSFPVIGNALSLLVIFILTRTCPPSLMSLAFAISAMPVVVIMIATVVLYSGRFKKVAPRIKAVDRTHIKDLFSLGARFFLIQIQVVVLYQSTNILISNLSGPVDVTSYNIAYKYIGIVMMAYSIILAPLWPAFTDAFTKRDYSWMQNVYRRMQRVWLVVSLAMLCLLLFSPLAYALWIGEKASIPFEMTFCVFLYMCIYNWDSLQVNLINGVGKIRLQTYVTFTGLILHVPLSIFLGRYMDLGAYGVIVSMIMINILYSSVFTVQINKILRNKAVGIWNK